MSTSRGEQLPRKRLHCKGCMCYTSTIVYRDSQEYFIHVPHSKEMAVVIIGIKVDTSASRHCHYHKRYSCHRRCKWSTEV